MYQKAAWRTTVCAIVLWRVGKEASFMDKIQESGTLRHILAHRCHVSATKTAEISYHGKIFAG